MHGETIKIAPSYFLHETAGHIDADMASCNYTEISIRLWTFGATKGKSWNFWNSRAV